MARVQRGETVFPGSDFNSGRSRVRTTPPSYRVYGVLLFVKHLSVRGWLSEMSYSGMKLASSESRTQSHIQSFKQCFFEMCQNHSGYREVHTTFEKKELDCFVLAQIAPVCVSRKRSECQTLRNECVCV